METSSGALREKEYSSKSRPRILVVDDEKDIRQLLIDCLSGDFEILEATDGSEALLVIEKTIPDLVILDIMMPGMSGWDVAARIKENEKWSTVPIVFLTAKGDEMSVGMGGLACEEYIVKPFDVVKLKECVDRILHVS